MGNIGGEDDLLLGVALLLFEIVVKDSRGSVCSTNAIKIGKRRVVTLRDSGIDQWEEDRFGINEPRTSKGVISMEKFPPGN